jgi:hemerythrin-like domain-containing protein
MLTPEEEKSNRRSFIVRTLGGCLSASALTTALPAVAAAAEEKEAEVSPAEDLMREHGVLNRVLLIYEEIGRRLSKGKEFDAKILSESAQFIRSFIETYHEQLEERHLFPRFEKANKLIDLVSVLRKQHEAGRELTTHILAQAKLISTTNATARSDLLKNLEAFTRMYRPHEAREDTVLFPALRELLTDKEYHELGDQFEKREHELFGKEGFETNVDKIAELERQLGIFELAQFTPLLPGSK